MIFFDSLHLRNQHQRRWIYYITAAIREQMAWKDEKQQSMWICHVVNSVRLFHKFLFVCLFVVNTSYFEHLQPIRTRRLIRTRKVQIRKVWNNIRSRNRYRSVVSVWFWDIDRFIILICRYFRDQDSQQNSQQDSHFRDFIYSRFSHFFFCFRIYFFTSVASVLELSASTMIRLISESQSTNFFAMSIDRRSDLFASKRSLKKTKK